MTTTNHLLSQLPGEIRFRLRPLLDRIRFGRGAVLTLPEQSLDYVYFVESGVASLTWPVPPRAIDVAMVGPEGFLGHVASLGGRYAIFGSIARTELTAQRMSVGDFQKMIRECPELNAEAFRFVRSLTRQIAECAYSNARATVEQRLARWIIMASERLGSGTIEFTHDCLASAIGCRRAGVTVAMHMLEGERIIKARRSRVTVIDARRLRETAAMSGEAEPIHVMRQPRRGATGACNAKTGG